MSSLTPTPLLSSPIFLKLIQRFLSNEIPANLGLNLSIPNLIDTE